MPPNRSANPACPRCDYDQSGAIASWAEACPLRGTCPECGYEFAWREVFCADERVNPRFVEHARRRSLPGAAWRTWAWVVLPAYFWRTVQLRHEVRPRRWLAWAVLTLGTLHLLAGVAIVTGRWLSETRRVIPPGFPGTAPFDWWWVVDTLGWPVIDVQGGFFGPYGFRSIVPAVPLWSTSSTFMAALSVMVPLLVLLMPQTRRRYKVRTRHVLRAAVYSWWWLAIPAGLRLAVGLRWIFDQMVFGRELDLGGMYGALQTYALPLMVAGLAWQVMWWGRAMSLGWRMKGAWGHAVFLVMGAGVIALLCAMAHDPHLRDRVLGLTGRATGKFGWRH